MRRSAILLVLLTACGTYSPLDSHYNRGVEFYDQGKLADAIREYELALEDNPENYRARYNLAVSLHALDPDKIGLSDLGKKEDAAAEYLKVLKLDPENARARVSLASIRADEGKDAESLKLLEEAAQADRRSSFPQESLGAYYERKGDLDRALQAYRAGAEIEPASAASHAGIARILSRRAA